MRTKKHTFTRQGFTIIELLVVVGIISLLASLTYPAINKLRERSKELQCSNNVKNWVFAMLQYADANSGKFPTDGLTDSVANQEKFWYEVLPPLLGMPSFSEQKAADKIHAPQGGKSSFICPSHSTIDQEAPITGAPTFSYGMNYWINARKGEDRDQFDLPNQMRTSHIRYPESFVLFSETLDYKLMVTLFPKNAATTSEPAFRHGGRVICAFADGHITGAPIELACEFQWNPMFNPGQDQENGK